MKDWLPTLPQISREALAVLAGAVIAGAIISQWPALKAYLRANGVLPASAQ